MSTFTVKFPDGTRIEGIPEGTPREAIAARYEQETGKKAPPPSNGQQPPTAQPGFLERSGDRIVQGVSDAFSTIAGDTYGQGGDPTARRDEGVIGKAMSVAGSDLIPAVGDVFGDGVITAGKAVLPESAQRALGDTVEAAMDTDVVKLGMEKWGEFEKANPDLARRIGQTANIAGVVAPVPKIPKVSSQAYGRVRGAKKVEGRSKEVRNMLQPDARDAKGEMTTEGGIFDFNKYEGTPYEEAMYETVAKLPEVQPRGSFSSNRKAVATEAERLRKELDAKLRDGGRAVEVDSLKTALANTANAFGRNPLLAGNADSAANQVYLATKKIIDEATEGKKMIEMDELLQVRRELDSLSEDWIGGMFENGHSARKMAVMELRNSINDIVAKNAPDDVNLKADLTTQSHLLAARDILSPRAHQQAGNRFTRALQDLERATGLRHPTTPQGIRGNLGDLPTAAVTALVASGVGLGKPMTRAARGAYHNFLKGLEGLQKQGVDKAAVNSMRLAVLDILKANPQSEDLED